MHQITVFKPRIRVWISGRTSAIPSVGVESDVVVIGELSVLPVVLLHLLKLS